MDIVDADHTVATALTGWSTELTSIIEEPGAETGSIELSEANTSSSPSSPPSPSSPNLSPASDTETLDRNFPPNSHAGIYGFNSGGITVRSIACLWYKILKEQADDHR